MDDFLKEHGTAAIIILWFLVLASGAFAYKLFWDKLNTMQDRATDMDKDIKAIKDNYLSRFSTMQEHLVATNKEMLDKVHELHVLILQLTQVKLRKR